MMNDATNYAKSQADLFKQSLQYLVEQQNQQKLLDEQALSQRYTNLVNQVNQKRLPIEQQFGQDAKGAYANKMLSQQNVNDSLNRMNLSNSGFGMGQRIGVDTAYGQNLNALTLNRNNQLSGINNEVTNIEGQRLTDLLGLQSQYAGRTGELNQYITKAVDEKYNQEYNNYMKNKEYEEMLKQQAWENDYKNRALKASSSGGGGSFGGGGTSFTDGGTILENNTPIQPAETPVTPQYKDTDVVKANRSPMLSSKTATSWLDKNISTPTIQNNGITIAVLKSKLSDAFNKKIMTADDIKKVLNTYGLK